MGHEINIWNKDDFQMRWSGDRCRMVAIIEHTINCIKWSWQRIVHGYAECDKWSIYEYLQTLIPNMLQDLRDSRKSSSDCIEGDVVIDSSYEEWNNLLDNMIFFWRESKEDTCTVKNIYEDEYKKALVDFQEKYGTFGEKLQTEVERKRTHKTGVKKCHFMDELSEYKGIYEKYNREQHRLKKYRGQAKDEALEMMKRYFYHLRE